MTHAELTALLDAARTAHGARPDVPLALATLVAVDGSSYRQPGACMLCDAEGRVLAGAISGGCLEQDVAERARGVCDAGVGMSLSYDVREDLETIWGFGTGCDGVAHIVLAPLPDLSLLEEAAAAADSRVAGTLLTVAASPDASSVGRTWFARDALTIRPPSAEAPVPELVRHTVQHTNRPYLGERRSDSGTDRIFGAPIRPPVHVVVVGASRGAESFARVAAACGWRITIVDHRVAALDALDVPNGTDRLVLAAADAGEAIRSGTCPCDTRTMFALCTHRFDHDLAWLEAALAGDAPYIGVLGSRQRAVRLLRALGDAGRILRARDRARLFAPIGLDIGGESPHEIALAAIAEMQAVLEARPGGSLRERSTLIHMRSDTPSFGADPVAAACRTPAPFPRTPR